ncbi:MAG: hypothetical protein IKX39_07920 [Muribaculaceae bacterium]|nr:hypothetical protein [Muribaculaceae bacterium]
MMKNKLLFCIMLLFAGMSMQAQSVATEEMDERFNNGTDLPYGWFTEGWKVDSTGVVKIEGSSSGFDIEEMMGGEGFDPSQLMESLMGGGNNDNYLLTPPLVVKHMGEYLVFSAKKEKKDDSGSGSSFSFGGSSDSTFVVERSVYSRNQWERVADFTTELDTIYKDFVITGTPAGEYRFRFRAGGGATVMIDSVAGFHFDSEAPDIYIIENDARAYHLDFSLCKEDSTRTLKVINTATGTLGVDITSEDPDLFSVNPTHLEVAAADSVDVNITFNFAAGQPGKNETKITFTPTDERVYGKGLNATAVVTQPDVWMEDFNANVQPIGFFTEGWKFRDNVATTSSGGGMEAMFGGGSSSFLMTPPLRIESINEVLLFSAKNGSGDDGMAGMGAMFGGGGSSVVVEKSVYGSNKWEKVKEFTEPLDSTYRTLWVGYIEPGEYRFRIIASDSIVVDSIAGFHLDENAPDIYVLNNNTAASAVNYGMPQADSTTSFAVVNTGTGTLQGAVASTDETTFALSTKEFAINASDTAFVDVTYLFDPELLGIHQGVVSFIPTTSVLAPLSYPLTAYSTYADAWTEDFEPEYLQEDETQPIDLPAGWETTGWEVRLPSSGGGLMDMLGGLMGGGDDSPKSWMATTTSEAYELITPRLQAKKGDVLRFEAKLGGGGLMDLLSMFMGGGASGQLNVFYKVDAGGTVAPNDDNWTYYDTFVQNGYVYFVAPYSGVYQLRFTSPSASLDNFYGFLQPIQSVAISEDNDNVNTAVFEQYGGQTVNVSYDRTLSATLQSDGTWLPRSYVVSLPYDYDFTDYYEADQAKIFSMAFKEEYYRQFIFLPTGYTNPNLMQAGRAYLVVVMKGQINLSAAGVTLNSTIVDDDQNVVNDFEDWYFNDNLTPVGKWLANFRTISDVEADAMNIYGLRDDGTWARFQSNGSGENSRMFAFRGYFELNASNEPAPAKVRLRSAPLPGTYNTMFQMSDQQGTSTGENVNYDNLSYEPTIPYPTEDIPTDIQPTLHAIDADGTHYYFDLLGRPLYQKPEQGVYIDNGQKVIVK